MTSVTNGEEAMHRYVILQNPGHNRVYFKESAKLAVAELMIACGRFENRCQNIAWLTLANVPYLSFETATPMSTDELRILSKLSFIFALYEQTERNDEVLLVPVAFDPADYVDPMISNLLKYSGKTNELFTKMMINIALLSSGYDYDQGIQLLDPVAGKGTTLYEGAVYGFDVAGIEVNKNAVHEACVFFKKFLEKGRYKHESSIMKGSYKEASVAFDIHVFEYAATKEAFKDAQARKKLKYVHGDTTYANRYFKRESVHLIVGDLPYGIVHGNRPKDKKLSPSRSSLNLLAECLPEWHKVLKKDGVLVLSWNKFVMSKKDLIQILNDNDFWVFSDDPYNDFEHRVDQSIKRDVVVARKNQDASDL